MRTYRGFLLDADNTLFDYDRCEGEAFLETVPPALPGVPPETARAVYRKINADYWGRFENHQLSAEELKIGRFQSLLAYFGTRGDAAELSASYLGALAGKAFLLPRAREVLEKLSRRATLCLITNGLTMVQRGRIAKSGLGPLFSAILISEELGLNKPDPRFFRKAVAASGLPRRELLCVGDNPSADIGGARAAGIEGCWYNPQGAAWPGPGEPPEHVIDDLRRLPGLAPAIG
jgi:2-haloacid dehalogenase